MRVSFQYHILAAWHAVLHILYLDRAGLPIIPGLTNPICCGITLHNRQEEKTNRDQE